MREEKTRGGRRAKSLMTSQWLRQIEQCLWPRGERRDIWMIVDAARDRQVFRLLLECHLNYSCLYSGTLPPALEIAAPYLVQLDYDYPDTRRLIQQAWGNNWGVFLRSDTSLEKLRRHLRTFLIVRDPAGQRLVFRYYDPRILRVYLPTCNEEDLRHVFGPIERFWTESKTPGNMLDFSRHRGKLAQRTLSLDTPTREPAGDLAFPNEEITGAPPLRGLLSIRAAQMAAFSQMEVRKFEDWMCTHATKFFPQQCAALGEPQLRELIQYGIARAAAHKITSKRDVCKFIDLMIVFGRDFDTEPRHAWAAEILARNNEPASKIRGLYAAATQRLKAS